MRKKLLLVVALVIVLTLPYAIAALADTTPVYVTLNSGTLSMTVKSSETLSTQTLANIGQVAATGTFTSTVDDSRGTGAGWYLTLQSSAFDTAAGKTISSTNLTGAPQAVTVNAGQSGADAPSAGGSGTLEIQRTVMSAAANKGMGNYSQDVNLSLLPPAGSYAGIYTASVTSTLNNAAP